MKSRFAFVITVATALSCSAITAVAADLYRWVDKDGKVHYSQTPPVAAPAAEEKIKIQPPSTPDPIDSGRHQAERDAQGNCLTIKCTADQMEADRLAREREYARRIAENEKAAKKSTNENKQPTIASGVDEHLRENCRKGLFYGSSSKINCDDIAALRKQWGNHQMGIKSGRDYLDRHPELKEPGYRR